MFLIAIVAISAMSLIVSAEANSNYNGDPSATVFSTRTTCYLASGVVTADQEPPVVLSVEPTVQDNSLQSFLSDYKSTQATAILSGVLTIYSGTVSIQPAFNGEAAYFTVDGIVHYYPLIACETTW